MEVWIMSARSESGEEYPSCAVWDHTPSKSEVDEIRVLLDASDFDEDNDSEENDRFIQIKDHKYITYITNFTISKGKIRSKI